MTIQGCAAMLESIQGTQTERVLRVHRVLNVTDFSMIRERIQREGSIEAGQIDKAVREYKRFMLLIAYANCGLAMCSKTVDEVWHTHILHTREYADFCQRAFGRFIHHIPNNSQHPGNPADVARFFELYETVFGAVPAVWGYSAECNTFCENECKSDCSGNPE